MEAFLDRIVDRLFRQLSQDLEGRIEERLYNEFTERVSGMVENAFHRTVARWDEFIEEIEMDIEVLVNATVNRNDDENRAQRQPENQARVGVRVRVENVENRVRVRVRNDNNDANRLMAYQIHHRRIGRMVENIQNIANENNHMEVPANENIQMEEWEDSDDDEQLP